MPKATKDKLDLVFQRWKSYKTNPRIDLFVDMTLALHALGEDFVRLRMSRLARLTEGLESVTLTLMRDEKHPLNSQQISTIDRQIDALCGALSLMSEPEVEKRGKISTEPEWAPRRCVHLIYEESTKESAKELAKNIKQVGFEVEIVPRRNLINSDSVRAVIIVCDSAVEKDELIATIKEIRYVYRYAQLFQLDAPSSIETQVELLRCGVDVLIQHRDSVNELLSEILDLTEVTEADPYRVLVVEDSKVASVIIQRTLKEHGIDSYPVRNPADILVALDKYSPDLILMDMQMPKFDGVEATRVVRQMRRWRSIPIVYLSGEHDIARQIEALRLGGDQFLTKPFNPIMLAAVVKTRVDRYRTAQRSTQIDGLTGLVTHSSGKERLQLLVEKATSELPVSVVMIDIDHFKSINDSFGHPFGDKIICSLAWLMRGKLRNSDLISRYGGEEFLVALPGANEKMALMIIENILSIFNSQEHAHGKNKIKVSFSAGISSSYQGNSGDLLVKQADSALLEAKSKGRNQVLIYNLNSIGN